ncbi:MAG: site-specific DNA-methyltransferase [bacterium]
MPKINLTPEDKARLIEAINHGTEPTADLLPKLFPGTAEKFDIQALDRAKIPTLEYAGKRSKAAILAEAGAGIGAAPLQIVRCFGEIKDDEWRNLIVQGDNLQFLKTCYNNTDPLIKDKVKGKVKLIYIDPPFATKSEFTGKDGERSYTDKVATAEFIEGLRERLIYMREILADDGSIYLHLDEKMSHYTKIIMDEVFGKDLFINEIIWKRSTSTGLASKRCGVLHDTIYWYAKSSNYIFNMQFHGYEDKYLKRARKDENGRLYIPIPTGNPGMRPNLYYEYKGYLPQKNGYKWTREKMEELDRQGRLIFPTQKSGRIQYKQYVDEMKGVKLQDLWTDIPAVNPVASERIDYPTQKPEALLERIILSSSNFNDLVIDLFAGSGTTSATADKLGRRWIACDFGKHSIYTMQKRMLHIGQSKALIEEKDASGKTIVKKGDPYNKKPKPFCIISSGAYDFSHIMDLRKHKDDYVDFVLGLFQLTRNEEKAQKFKLANIYTVKDNNPVEVYPVWDDEFLKEVKIDEAYLRGIIKQSGGKLKGDYYIITPETCTNISDTTLKNQDGKDVQFVIKTFPYKVLEDISRNFELQEQPSSQDNVNNLITSTAFYFNEDVKLEAERTEHGLRITQFESKILDKGGNRFEGFSGLTMLLVDLDYEPDKPFDMDKTVFAKEIDEDGSVKIDGLTKSVGLIAIDKHGNESKPFNLE